MKGDITRDTFDPAKQFSRVLMQQGRVTLDADHNEQTAILLNYIRKLARDLIGPYGAPFDDRGFVLTSDPKEVFTISKGRYYVDGILIENDTENCTYKTQPDFPMPADDALVAMTGQQKTNTGKSFWIYLDVWERHITAIEDDTIREKALGGPDTCTRAKVVWQVKAMETSKINTELNAKSAKLKAKSSQLGISGFTNFENTIEQRQVPPEVCAMPLQLFPGLSNAKLAARVDPGLKIEDACITPPASKYRGAENQLYRVEIHAGSKDKNGNAATPTFTWSRDNGSRATAWLGGKGNDLQVANTRGFAAGNWVELSDDNSELLGSPATLVQLVKVEGDTLSVDSATTLPPISNFPKHPKVRRWDYAATDAISLAPDNAIPIKESPANAKPDQIVWIDLEDGVQIQFSNGGEYRDGDYWLIPARVATGNVEWPQDSSSNPQPLPPHGVEHHYAPLGFILWNGKGQMQIPSCGCVFYPLNDCARFRFEDVQGMSVDITSSAPAPAPAPTQPAPSTKPKPAKPETKKNVPSTPRKPSP